MGMTAALKLRQVVDNAEHVLAIELMSAAQGLEYRLPLKAARQVGDARGNGARRCAPLDEDRVLSGDIDALAQKFVGSSLERADMLETARRSIRHRAFAHPAEPR